MRNRKLLAPQTSIRKNSNMAIYTTCKRALRLSTDPSRLFIPTALLSLERSYPWSPLTPRAVLPLEPSYPRALLPLDPSYPYSPLIPRALLSLEPSYPYSPRTPSALLPLEPSYCNTYRLYPGGESSSSKLVVSNSEGRERKIHLQRCGEGYSTEIL